MKKCLSEVPRAPDDFFEFLNIFKKYLIYNNVRQVKMANPHSWNQSMFEICACEMTCYV